MVTAQCRDCGLVFPLSDMKFQYCPECYGFKADHLRHLVRRYQDAVKRGGAEEIEAASFALTDFQVLSGIIFDEAPPEVRADWIG